MSNEKESIVVVYKTQLRYIYTAMKTMQQKIQAITSSFKIMKEEKKKKEKKN